MIAVIEKAPEIQFRWYDSAKSQFRYMQLGEGGEWSVDRDPEDSLSVQPVRDKSMWEQLTGLPDCKGEDVWVGDLMMLSVKRKPGKEYAVHQVVATPGGFHLVNVSDPQYRRSLRSALVRDKNRERWEVVGNIHQNPELLKKGGDDAKAN